MQEQLAHHQIQKQPIVHELFFLLDNVSDPINVGLIFRLAEGLGVKKVFLCERTPTLPNKMIRKTARNAIDYVDYQYFDSTLDALGLFAGGGFQVFALELTSQSVCLSQVRFLRNVPLVLVFGSESQGVQAEVLERFGAIHIPMFGHISSFNVVQAASIAGFEFVRQMLLPILD